MLKQLLLNQLVWIAFYTVLVVGLGFLYYFGVELLRVLWEKWNAWGSRDDDE